VELTACDMPLTLVLLTEQETAGYIGRVEVSVRSSDCFEQLRALCSESDLASEIHDDHLWFADPDETPWLFLDATTRVENPPINEGDAR
jgi:hypothetical protein